MTHHTLIVAQSGSGKSFLLGRLLEELLTNTGARCVMLDPNADFRKVHRLLDPREWETAAYNVAAKTGWLPTERSRSEFEPYWRAVTKTIRRRGVRESARSVAPLEVWWPRVDIACMTGDVPSMQTVELVLCHRFVKSLGVFFELDCRLRDQGTDFFEEAKTFLTLPEPGTWLRQRYDVKQIRMALQRKDVHEFMYLDEIRPLQTLDSTFQNLADDVTRSRNLITADMVNFYLRKIEEFKTYQILASRPAVSVSDNVSHDQLEVVDLLSLPNRTTRLLAVNETLTTEWEIAKQELARAIENPAKDRRVPVFIAADEAHNLMPDDARGGLSSAVRDQFRTIAAEGRKYGLFLLAVTQVPEKLDRFVISEFENLAVMKLSSRTAADVGSTLHLVSTKPRFEDLRKGRFILFGPWAEQQGLVGYVAGRRTRQGGKDLPDKWARYRHSVSEKSGSA